jgi:hypothetical protein
MPLQALVVPALRTEREGRGTHCIGDAREIKAWATRPLIPRKRGRPKKPLRDATQDGFGFAA